MITINKRFSGEERKAALTPCRHPGRTSCQHSNGDRRQRRCGRLGKSHCWMGTRASSSRRCYPSESLSRTRGSSQRIEAAVTSESGSSPATDERCQCGPNAGHPGGCGQKETTTGVRQQFAAPPLGQSGSLSCGIPGRLCHSGPSRGSTSCGGRRCTFHAWELAGPTPGPQCRGESATRHQGRLEDSAREAPCARRHCRQADGQEVGNGALWSTARAGGCAPSPDSGSEDSRCPPTQRRPRRARGDGDYERRRHRAGVKDRRRKPEEQWPLSSWDSRLWVPSTAEPWGAPVAKLTPGQCLPSGAAASATFWLSRCHSWHSSVQVLMRFFACSTLPLSSSCSPPVTLSLPWSVECGSGSGNFPLRRLSEHWAFARAGCYWLSRFELSWMPPACAFRTDGGTFLCVGDSRSGSNRACSFGCTPSLLSPDNPIDTHVALLVCGQPGGGFPVSLMFPSCGSNRAFSFGRTSAQVQQRRQFSLLAYRGDWYVRGGLSAKQWYRWLWDHGYAPLTYNAPPPTADTADTLLASLLSVAAWLVPFFRGLLGCLFISLLAGLVRPVRPRHPGIGRSLMFPLSGASLRPFLALGQVVRAEPCLDWSPWRNKHGRLGRRPGTNPPPFREGFRSVSWILLSLLALPDRISAPAVLMCSAWTFVPGAYAMSRPETHGDTAPEDLRPMPAAISPPPGLGAAAVPWHDAGREHRAAEKLYCGPLPWHDACPAEGERHIGVYLYTPHYRPHAFAVKLQGECCLRQVLDVVLDCAPGDPAQVCDFIVPTCPQRSQGYLTALRMPSIVRGMQGGMVGVICDFTYVGGDYFATCLPKQMSLDSLLSFARPLSREDIESLYFFIGLRQRPWPASAIVTFRDGDVIQASSSPDPRPRQLHPEALFQPDADLGPMCHFFDVEVHEARCVMYRDARYTIAPHTHPGLDLISYCVQSFKLRWADVLCCTFPIEELDVHGMSCADITSIVEVPAIREGDPIPDRCDIFTLCDFRPLGSKPRIVLSHVPLIHLPSLLSNLGIQLPAAYTVAVVGGRMRGDHVKIRENMTLLFYAKLVESSDSSSASEGEEEAPDRDVPMPYVSPEPEQAGPPDYEAAFADPPFGRSFPQSPIPI